MVGMVKLHRVLKAAPEIVYRAFIDPDALARWLPPNGFTGRVHSIDAKVGGGYTMSFTNFSNGNSHFFTCKYLELSPHKKIVYVDQFDDPNLPGEMRVTVTFIKVSCGTDLHIVQEGIPEAIPVDMCYLGWQDSLNFLAQLVD